MYRVELAVRDEHDSATFVVFDSEMKKLLSKTAATLTAEAAGMNESDLPPSLANLAGQTFVFQLKVTSFNFTPRPRTFIVVRMTAQPPADGVEKDGDAVPPPDSPPPPPKKMNTASPTDVKKKSVVSPGEGVQRNPKKARE